MAEYIEMTTTISVRLPEKLAKQLDSIALEMECSRSFIIQKALESYVDDFSDFQIALDRLHDKNDVFISGQRLRTSLDV